MEAAQLELALFARFTLPALSFLSPVHQTFGNIGSDDEGSRLRVVALTKQKAISSQVLFLPDIC